MHILHVGTPDVNTGRDIAVDEQIYVMLDGAGRRTDTQAGSTHGGQAKNLSLEF